VFPGGRPCDRPGFLRARRPWWRVTVARTPSTRRSGVQGRLPQDHDPVPRAVRGRLTDFGPDRSKVFSKSADDYLRVHDLGSAEADLTEGSGAVWERLHYDWSNQHVVLRTTDSNVWGGASGYTYNPKRQPDGMTDVDVVIVREGKNAKGRILGLVLRTVGKSVLGKAFANSIEAIEARDNGVPPR
jgi:hypothetical protein